jgi:hypothetical protein
VTSPIVKFTKSINNNSLEFKKTAPKEIDKNKSRKMIMDVDFFCIFLGVSYEVVYRIINNHRPFRKYLS